ncbi:MAG: hypothetical protein MUF01_02385 [Bryobacterales bacterium]|jgi:hypothetical protein|nr:hypothetical protein [Bryobacterales bacterium]
MSGPILSFECAGLAAIVVLQRRRGCWALGWAWECDHDLAGSGYGQEYADRAQAICAGVRELLRSLDAADPLRRNPAVTGVARQRMDRIRKWAKQLADQHRPVAQAMSLFGGGA